MPVVGLYADRRECRAASKNRHRPITSSATGFFSCTASEAQPVVTRETLIKSVFQPSQCRVNGLEWTLHLFCDPKTSSVLPIYIFSGIASHRIASPRLALHRFASLHLQRVFSLCTMAPVLDSFHVSTLVALVTESRDDHDASLARRNLQHPNHTQAVTLGVIAAYAVGIAILWNVPYLRMVLWPFKVSLAVAPSPRPFLTLADACHRLP